ncbi:uncharacterized protein TRIADDRAFT_54419 [Trichoplax adhaerens]|uniref:Coiled-coil domain-containing protein 14 n=1 Tax=Trichoplax adhaerens TaxID=10228 RepID=B3RRZ4_TRIAD|nr:hypothetical protein TRIADDRAFT_54419 [Trichoplax adhaerens]EDV26957.1 hypothetical protein TRIADDRAFT_54419 [Trichoplax adhaerens]|eukprot:XP_002110953.1 hypothetical protein TRIADDRAFT_54419 [Trichoplax adhaerens]
MLTILNMKHSEKESETRESLLSAILAQESRVPSGKIRDNIHSTDVEDPKPLISFELLQRQQELLNKQLRKEAILRKQLADLQRKQSRIENEQKQFEDRSNTQSHPVSYPNEHATPAHRTKKDILQANQDPINDDRNGFNNSIAAISPYNPPPSPPPQRLDSKACTGHVKSLQKQLNYLRNNIRSYSMTKAKNNINEIDKYIIKIQSELKDYDKADQYLQSVYCDNSRLRRQLRLSQNTLKEFEETVKENEKRQDQEYQIKSLQTMNNLLEEQVKKSQEGLLNERQSVLHHKETISQLSRTAEEFRDDIEKLKNQLVIQENQYRQKEERLEKKVLQMEAERAELTARLEVTQMSLEAAKKEQQILSIAVQQKEAEINRHEDISRLRTKEMMTGLVTTMEKTQNKNQLNSYSYDAEIKKQEPISGVNHNYSLESYLPTTSGLQVSDTVSTKSTSPGSKFNPYRTLQHNSPKRDQGGQEYIMQNNGMNPDQHSEIIVATNKTPEKKKPIYDALDNNNHRYQSESTENVLLNQENNDYAELKDRNYQQSHDAVLDQMDDDATSAVSSKDEVEFRKELAILDADIERLQRSLKYLKYN